MEHRGAVAMVAIVVIGALIAGAFFTSTQEYRIGRNSLVDQRAFSAAEAGVNQPIQAWVKALNLSMKYQCSPAAQNASSAITYFSARSSSSGAGMTPVRTCRARRVPSSTIREYADTWSGSHASAASTDVCQSTTVSPGVP